MTSSNGNIFRVTGLCAGHHRRIPRTKASDAELWCFLWSAPWINDWVKYLEAGDLRRHCAHYDVILICISPCVFCRQDCACRWPSTNSFYDICRHRDDRIRFVWSVRHNYIRFGTSRIFVDLNENEIESWHIRSYGDGIHRKSSIIRRTKFQNLNVSRFTGSCLCPIH